jgi:hypothetical protein
VYSNFQHFFRKKWQAWCYPFMSFSTGVLKFQNFFWKRGQNVFASRVCSMFSIDVFFRQVFSDSKTLFKEVSYVEYAPCFRQVYSNCQHVSKEATSVF